MSEDKEGTIFSLTDKLKDIEQKEIEENRIAEPWAILTYILKEYFSGEDGQSRLMKILGKKIPDRQDREDVLDVINELLNDNDEDDPSEEAETLDKEFNLVEILCSAIKKTKEQVVQEFAEEYARLAREVRKIIKSAEAAPAPVIKFPKK